VNIRETNVADPYFDTYRQRTGFFRLELDRHEGL
jgi:hypothetical protein